MGGEIIIKLAIIADDLTGATDTGVQFSKKGFSTTVLFSNTELKPSYLSGEVIVLNSDSRALDFESAYKNVASLSKELKEIGVTSVFKKIDSTMRGNIGHEIEAVMDVMGYKTSFVIAAFPKNGRVTINGHHYVHEIPLEKTDIAKDPSCPVTDGNLPRLLKKQCNREVDLIELDHVRSGKDYLANYMQNLVSDHSSKIVVIDATTDEELETIIEAIQNLKEKVLIAGSAGIAFHLYNSLEREMVISQESNKKQLPVLVVAGSVNSVTEQQVQVLKNNTAIEEIMISPEKFFKEGDREIEINRAVEVGNRLLKQGNVVLSTNRSAEAIEKVKVIQRLRGMPSIKISQTISHALGEIAGQLIETNFLSGVVLTGGDIAAATCNRLSGKGIRVIGEVEDGIPFGRLLGGRFDHLPLVTKAGAFGTNEALIKAVKKIIELNNNK
ncbi:four-carbon acid sugar kinase family protein [Bacillaceae bacterium IKA-2]|nr:four-carbon acid sugar kinase family protein [Bacillaceae bacterium IKA-2]